MVNIDYFQVLNKFHFRIQICPILPIKVSNKPCRQNLQFYSSCSLLNKKQNVLIHVGFGCTLEMPQNNVIFFMAVTLKGGGKGTIIKKTFLQLPLGKQAAKKFFF